MVFVKPQTWGLFIASQKLGMGLRAWAKARSTSTLVLKLTNLGFCVDVPAVAKILDTSLQFDADDKGTPSRPAEGPAPGNKNLHLGRKFYMTWKISLSRELSNSNKKAPQTVKYKHTRLQEMNHKVSAHL